MVNEDAGDHSRQQASVGVIGVGGGIGGGVGGDCWWAMLS